ncbi:hypothetical protein M9458_023147, partial [Cirrhinus mrigala]
VANKTHLSMSVRSHKPPKSHLLCAAHHICLYSTMCFHLRRAMEPSANLHGRNLAERVSSGADLLRERRHMRTVAESCPR